MCVDRHRRTAVARVRRSTESGGPEWLLAFAKKLNDYVESDAILHEDADAMARRAGLCPPRRSRRRIATTHDKFVAVKPCGN